MEKQKVIEEIKDKEEQFIKKGQKVKVPEIEKW